MVALGCTRATADRKDLDADRKELDADRKDLDADRKELDSGKAGRVQAEKQVGRCRQSLYRGASLIRNSTPRQDHHGALSIVLR